MRLAKVSKYILPIIFLFSFALLSKYEDREVIKTIDVTATVKVQDRIDNSAHLRLAALVDNSMEGATFFASPELSSVLVLILTAIAFRQKKWRALLIPAAFILIVLVEMYGKSVVHHPSPPFSMIKHTTSVFPANYINEQFSYPSGHAARAVFLSICVYSLFLIHNSLFKNAKLKLLVVLGLFIYVVMVATSRIYLGHHWFSDVAGGLLLGSGLGVLTLATNSPIIDKQ